MALQFKKICWSVTLFLILNPIISVLMLVLYLVFSDSYTLTQIISVSAFGLFFAVLTNLSITMGYHRLFAHKSFEAHPVLEWILLFISSGAFQGSALKWSSDHRIHHKYEDTEKDPYSIKKGFWYAHIGWMMTHKAVSLPISAPDLEKNKLIKFQHDYYLYCAIAVGYAMPLLIGWILGNAFLGIVIAGGLRIFLTQQSTFFVNSLSHTLGKTPYCLDKTAKDSLIVAFLTHGEGYHNFHHKFQFDYRNGIRWYHWDPTKWTIQLAALAGLAKKLKTVQFSEILKARLEVEAIKLKKSNLRTSAMYNEKLEVLSAKIVEAQAKFEKLKKEYSAAKDQKVIELRAEIELMNVEIDSMMRKWKILIRSAQAMG
ncbi:fatty acid desaturase [bacterium]|nr:fatty acid desaturase [bacterium]